MPIEIKEMHIKINVEGDAKKGGKKTAPQGGDSSGGAVLQECMDEVMKVLKNKKER